MMDPANRSQEMRLMADKSPHRSKDKKQGRSLQEKRMAKRQKRAQRLDEAQARGRLEGSN
jgi:hypothetical protein